MPVRFLVYVAITALTRLLLKYVNDWQELKFEVLIVCGSILLLSGSILVLRYASHTYPSDKKIAVE